MLANKSRVLIFSSAEEAYSVGLNDNFVTKLNERLEGDSRIEWHNYHDIRLEFATGKINALIQSSGEPLDAFRFVYFKSYFRYSEQAAALAECLTQARIPFVCSELDHYMPLTKLTQYARLARAGIPIPETIYVDALVVGGQFDYLAGTLGTPFIFKSTDGSGGRENYLIHSDAELKQALADNPELQFVAQKFVANDSDLRVLIVDRRIELIIQRRRSGDSHMNNTSQGGAATLMAVDDLRPEHQRLALQAAELMGREIAGVDLMFEAGTGNPYILEVNASPQIGSGAFVEEKLDIYSNYFKNMVK